MNLVSRLAEYCREQHFPVWVVGGGVRDRLLGRPAVDVDVVTSFALARARDFAADARAFYVVLDRERGTARVVNRQDRSDQLDFNELAGDLETDLRRRDFTLNAIACELPDWLTDEPTWLDPTGGVTDLRARVLRAVSDRSLLDDPLRTLRAFRFAAVLGLTVEPETARLVAQAAPRLADIPGERVLQEWLPLLRADEAPQALPQLATTGLLRALLPDWPADRADRLSALGPVLEFYRSQPRLAAWLAHPDRLPLLRFASLLGPGGPAAATVTQRFCLSRAQRKCLAAMRLDVTVDPSPGRAALAELLLGHGRDGLGALAVAAADGRLESPKLRAVVEALEQEVLPAYESNPWVTGRQLQAQLGVEPCEAYGPALAAARLAQVGGAAATPAEALEFARRALQNDD